MTELLNDVDAPSDAELISRVRGGDAGAYGELFSRHVSAANRLARQLVRGPDADDLVAEAFAKVLSVLQSGGGPDVAFRAYLLTAVRRLHVDRVRAGAKLQTTDDLTPFDPGIPFQDTAVAGFESGAAAKAFASLPERWQLVLWHLEVEGQKPADIAPLLGMSPNSVSALAYRAREGLRQAFLTMHLADISEIECRWVNEHLGAYVRNGLSKRDSGKLQTHLDACRRCTAMYLELTEVNSDLSAIIAPLLLGAAATGYVASTGGVSTAGVLSLFSRAKDVVLANTGAATAAGAVAAGVAVAAVVGITLATSHPKDATTTADKPVGTVSTAPAAPAPAKSAGSSAKKHAVPPVSPALAPTPNPVASPAGVYPTATASALPTSLPVAAANPVAPAPAPTSAAPTSAGPKPPVTQPSQPTPSQPTPSQPQPTQPQPTQPPPPPPTQPSPPPLIDTTLGFTTDPALANGTLTVSLSGGDVPPKLRVSLSGDVAGISFATDPTGQCQPVVGAATPAVDCSTTPQSIAAGAAGVPALAATPPGWNHNLRLNVSPSLVDRQVFVHVIGDGYRFQGTKSELVSRAVNVPKAVDVALALTGPTVDPTDTGLYDVQGIVTGIPPVYAGDVSFGLSGPASWVVSDGSGCRVEGPMLTCPSSVLVGNTVHLVVSADEPSTPTDVSVTMAPLDGYVDPTPNDAQPTTLLAWPRGDVALTDPTVTPRGDDYQIDATVTGVPDGYTGGATLTLTGDAHFSKPAPGDCAIGGDGTSLTCNQIQDGSITLHVTDHHNATTPITFAVSDLIGHQQNQATPLAVTLPAVADVALSLPPSVAPGADGSYDVTGTVLGIPDGYTGDVSFNLNGPASWAVRDGSGCSVSGTVLSCPASILVGGNTVPLTMETDRNTVDSKVSVTMQQLDGYLDPTPNEPQPVTLTLWPRGDVALTDPTVTPRADDYEVDATVTGVPDGYTGGAALTLTGDAHFSDPAPDGCTIAGDRKSLTCGHIQNGSMTLRVTAEDTRTTTPITLAVGDLPAHQPTAAAPLSVDLPPVRTGSDFGFLYGPSVVSHHDKSAQVWVMFDNVPSDSTVDLYLDGAQREFVTSDTSCDVDPKDAQHLVCRPTASPFGWRFITFEAKLPAQDNQPTTLRALLDGRSQVSATITYSKWDGPGNPQGSQPK